MDKIRAYESRFRFEVPFPETGKHRIYIIIFKMVYHEKSNNLKMAPR